MDDNTPTDVTTPQDAGVEAPNVEASALPDQVEDAPAVETQDTQPEATTQEDGDKLSKWAASQNIDLNNPTPEDAKKLAKVARDNQVASRQKSQEVSEFEKRVTNPQTNNTGGDEVLAEVRAMRAERDAERKLSDFKQRNPGWEEHKDALSAVLNESVPTPYGQVSRAELVDTGILSLDDALTLAKGSAAREQQLKAEGGRESLERLANKQMAEAPKALASDQTPQPKEEEDPMLAGFDEDVL